MKRGHKQIGLCGIAMLIGQLVGLTQVLVTDESEVAYPLKVGYVTYDAVSDTAASPAFIHLTEHLKRMCASSRRGSGKDNRTGRSDWLRSLDVNIAYGSDYQVLNWLRSGRIDATMLCPESLYFYDTGMTNLIRLVVPTGDACTSISRPVLRSQCFLEGSWTLQPNPEEDYQAFLQSIADTPSKKSPGRYQLVASSHFSAAGFIAPVTYAKKWLTNFHRTSTRPAPIEDDGHFWNLFFTNLAFSLGCPDARSCITPPPEGTTLIEFSADSRGSEVGWTGFSDTNYVVFASFTNVLLGRSDMAQKFYKGPLLNKSPLMAELDPVVESLLGDARWKKLAEPKFTITEVIALLHQSQETFGDKELSLVLSGGGVKAAYQSTLIDYLYSHELLSNSREPPVTALQVKSIVGNSGGALLGLFVAGLEPKDARSLSTNLWRLDGRLMTDREIFGFMDLPRWASFVVSAWVIIAVLRLGHWGKGSASLPARVKGLPLSYWCGMVAMVILTPILLQVVNGEYGVEHVPWVEGLFFFLCLCLLLFIDNCVVPNPLEAPDGAKPRWMLQAIGVALLTLGGGTAVFLAACSWRGHWKWLTDEIARQMTIGGALFCGCVLLSWVGLVCWVAARGRCQLSRPWVFVKMVAMAIFIILLAYATMLLWVWMNWITFLELTPGFWVALIALTAFWSLIYFWVFDSNKLAGRLSGKPLLIFTWLREGFEYQRSRHPSGVLSLTRLARTHIIFTFGYCLWNAVVAPAIYGNKNAHNYLVNAMSRFVKDSRRTDKAYELQTLYAAPANDLAAQRERYFLFYPQRDDLSNTVALLTEKLNEDARKRWTVLPYTKTNSEYMQKVVFASGSPFPIFPPHAIPSVTTGVKERLVDGGFAHNIPIEAARQLGAQQVIVLDSSPPSSRRVTGEGKTNGPVFGQFSLNIPRLLPFLFESSQVGDFLSREEMFIVWFAPREQEKKWPSLFDFRKKTVQQMLGTARGDTNARIGRIEACGIPSFRHFIRAEPIR